MPRRIQGRRPPLFLDQTEGRKKFFFETAQPPPPTPTPPYLKVWIFPATGM